MLKVTLEWNAVTTLDDPTRSGWESLTKIVAAHKSVFDVGIVTTAASENSADKTFWSDVNVFEARLEAVEMSDLKKVLTMGCYDLTYYDYCFLAEEDDEALVDKLWAIPPKGVPRTSADFAKMKGLPSDMDITAPEFARWRNHWCDVHSWHAHIKAKRDVFVTGDTKNFRGPRMQQLIDLGIGDICSYDDAWMKYGSESSE